MKPRTPMLTLAAALTLLALIPSAADARYWAIPGIKPRSVSVDLFGGYHVFFQEEENFRNNGIFGGGIGFNFNEFVGLEAAVRYVPTLTHQRERAAHVLLPKMDLIFHMGKWPAVPYLSAGVGMRYLQIKRTAEGSGTEYDFQPKNPDTDFAWDAGGGVKILFISRLGLRIDARYTMIIGPANEEEAVVVGDMLRDTWDNLSITAGIFALIGGPPDDPDGDGIPSKVDDCPDVPEDFDDFEDWDGCPEEDNDADTFLDWEDDCPNHAEDEDGFEDADGCPETDNDYDGVLDGDDVCPNDPENANGYEDEDGCPDEVPRNLTKIVGVIRGINFKVDSDELKPSSYSVLDEAAATLLKYDDIALEIQGHASAEGDDDYNMDLSQRRAESVMRYLISKGISERRLVAIGYGETRPLEEDTPDGRVINRRVEFHLITGSGG